MSNTSDQAIPESNEVNVNFSATRPLPQHEDGLLKFESEQQQAQDAAELTKWFVQKEDQKLKEYVDQKLSDADVPSLSAALEVLTDVVDRSDGKDDGELKLPEYIAQMVQISADIKTTADSNEGLIESIRADLNKEIQDRKDQKTFLQNLIQSTKEALENTISLLTDRVSTLETRVDNLEAIQNTIKEGQAASNDVVRNIWATVYGYDMDEDVLGLNA